jgi:putative transposase
MRTARNSSFEQDLIDRLVSGRDARTMFERNGILERLSAALNERFRQLDAEPAAAAELEVDVDGARELERFRLRFPDLSERIISLHAKGYPQAEIQRRASMLVGQQVPPALIAALLAEVRGEALDWQSRALEPSYPIVVFERVRVKWRAGSAVKNRICHFAMGFQSHGPKEVLGLWFDGDDEQRYWFDVLGDLRRRGVHDVLYLMGSDARLADAAGEMFPSARVVPNVGDYVRQSLELATSKDRAGLAKMLRAVHGAATAADAEHALASFADDPLGRKYPAVAPIWRRHWTELAAYFDVPAEVRRVMGSTHAADALRRGYARTLKGHGHMTSVGDATALMYLVVRETLRRWRRPQREWHAAKTQLAFMYPERFIAN